MLTIKNVLPNGIENVYEAQVVHYEPNCALDDKGAVWSGDSGSDTAGFDHRFDEGVVYVMNHMGKTVSTYHLKFPVTSNPPDAPR